jgi:hypothetical protein
MCIGSSQSAEHQTDHADVQPGFGMGGFDFVMTHEAAMIYKPAKGSLDNPTFGQRGKAPPGFVPRHDFQSQRAGFSMRGHPIGEVVTAVALVSPQTTQPPESSQCRIQEAAGTGAFGQV